MPNTYTLIQSSIVGSGGAATVSFTSIPSTYTDLKLVYSARNTVSGTQEFIKITFNSNTTGYTFITFQGNEATPVSNNFSQQWVGYAVGSTATASTFSSGEIYIPGYALSNNKVFTTANTTENNAAGFQSVLGANLWANTAAITSIDLTMQGGYTIDQYSTFRLYGIKNS